MYERKKCDNVKERDIERVRGRERIKVIERERKGECVREIFKVWLNLSERLESLVVG